MAVKENLTGLQVGIKGIKTEQRVYLSNEAKGKIHIRLENENIWVKTDSLIHALNDLLGEKNESGSSNF